MRRILNVRKLQEDADCPYRSCKHHTGFHCSLRLESYKLPIRGTTWGVCLDYEPRHKAE